jgi:hypothetical protein
MIRDGGPGMEATAVNNLLEYENIAEFWDEWEDWKERRYLMPWRYGHAVIKKMWDAYKAPRGVNDDNTLLAHIRRSFPKDPEARSARPMGDFKDMMDQGMSHEDMYNALRLKLTIPRINRKGQRSNYLNELWPHANKLFLDYFDEDYYGKNLEYEWDRDLFVKAMCIMMYSSTIGLVMEERAHGELAAWLASTKASRLFTYEPASSQLESKDVDGVFLFKDSDEVAVNVSIKSVGAFTRSFIDKQYRNKGKTTPDIYAGYPSQTTEEIEFILVEGKDLKTLLQEAHSERRRGKEAA